MKKRKAVNPTGKIWSAEKSNWNEAGRALLGNCIIDSKADHFSIDECYQEDEEEGEDEEEDEDGEGTEVERPLLDCLSFHLLKGKQSIEVEAKLDEDDSRIVSIGLHEDLISKIERRKELTNFILHALSHIVLHAGLFEIWTGEKDTEYRNGLWQKVLCDGTMSMHDTHGEGFQRIHQRIRTILTKSKRFSITKPLLIMDQNYVNWSKKQKPIMEEGQTPSPEGAHDSNPEDKAPLDTFCQEHDNMIDERGGDIEKIIAQLQKPDSTESNKDTVKEIVRLMTKDVTSGSRVSYEMVWDRIKLWDRAFFKGWLRGKIELKFEDAERPVNVRTSDKAKVRITISTRENMLDANNTGKLWMTILHGAVHAYIYMCEVPKGYRDVKNMCTESDQKLYKGSCHFGNLFDAMLKCISSAIRQQHFEFPYLKEDRDRIKKGEDFDADILREEEKLQRDKEKLEQFNAMPGAREVEEKTAAAWREYEAKWQKWCREHYAALPSTHPHANHQNAGGNMDPRYSMRGARDTFSQPAANLSQHGKGVSWNHSRRTVPAPRERKSPSGSETPVDTSSETSSQGPSGNPPSQHSSAGPKPLEREEAKSIYNLGFSEQLKVEENDNRRRPGFDVCLQNVRSNNSIRKEQEIAELLSRFYWEPPQELAGKLRKLGGSHAKAEVAKEFHRLNGRDDQLMKKLKSWKDVTAYPDELPRTDSHKYYELLGLKTDVGHDELRNAINVALRKNHTDKTLDHTTTGKTTQLLDARTALYNAMARKLYDMVERSWNYELCCEHLGKPPS